MRPISFSVLMSKVRISVKPPMSSVTTMRSSAMELATTRAPFGNVMMPSAVAAALPPARKTRYPMRSGCVPVALHLRGS